MAELTADTPMSDVLRAFPGAQRALFAKYHIGGCQSCAFSPTETLSELCARNENIPVDEVISHIQENHDGDAKILISPQGLSDEMNSACKPRLLDIRTKEEYEAVNIPGSQRFTQELIQEIFGTWEKESAIVIVDHTGDRCLDLAAYLIGHGFGNTHALEGGIDAWSQEIDTSLPRYRLEMED